jgi:hypothetical protein
MKESDLYRMIDPPSELASLTPDDLLALRQAVLKHGIADAKLPVMRLYSTNPDVGVTVCKSVASRTILVADSDMVKYKGFNLTPGESFTVQLVFVQGFDPGEVWWAKGITIEEVRAFTSQAEELRKIIDNSPEPVKSVAHFFRKQGTAIPVLSVDSPEETMREFDHPEDLVVWESGWGQSAIIHKRDVPYMELRKGHVLKLLASKGIDVRRPGWSSQMSPAEIIKLRQEIHNAMQQ